MRELALLALGACLVGCSEAPGVDLTAVWVGRFTIEGGGAGQIVLDLRQTDASVAGTVALLVDGVPDNGSIWASGTVAGHHASLEAQSTDDQLEAEEASGTLEGTLGAGATKATFTAARVDTHPMAVGASRPALGSVPRLLAAQGGHLWFYDWGSRTLREMGDDDQELGALPLPEDIQCQGLDGCGEALACADSAAGVDFIDPTTGAVTSRVQPTDDDLRGVACGAGELWVGTSPSGVLHLDTSGKVLGTATLPLLVSEIAFDGADVWMLPSAVAVLFRLDPTTGALRAAYQLPDSRDDYRTWGGLTWDGSALWGLQTIPPTGAATGDTVTAVRFDPSSG